MTRKTTPGTIAVTLPPEIDGGGTITMRTMRTRDYLALRKGNNADEQIDMTLAAIVKYLPGKDPLDLPIEDLIGGVMLAWVEAKAAEVLPPPSA